MIFYSKYKKIRRERKISLEDISKKTKVHIKYLRFIESGKFSEIPSIYTKLFFKAYVSEIGCNVDEAIKDLENFLNDKKNNRTNNNEKVSDKSLFKISFSHLQKSNILVGIIFLSLVCAIILLQNRPDSSIEEQKALLRLTKEDIESIYAINSNESFSENLQIPVNIRFNSIKENYINFLNSDGIFSEHFFFEEIESNAILEEWDGRDKDIIIANTKDVELTLASKSEFGQMLVLSDRISNNFPVLISLSYDPLVISITKYTPKR